MDDATAIVTGGGGAIGGSAARHLAERGVRVLVVDVDGERAAQTVAEIERAGGTAAPHAADVSDADEVAGYVEACRARSARRACSSTTPPPRARSPDP